MAEIYENAADKIINAIAWFKFNWKILTIIDNFPHVLTIFEALRDSIPVFQAFNSLNDIISKPISCLRNNLFRVREDTLAFGGHRRYTE
jgi:hypothetical protein